LHLKAVRVIEVPVIAESVVKIGIRVQGRFGREMDVVEDGEYISIVHDRFEDVRTAPGKRSVPIPLKKTQIPAGLFFLTLRKRNRNLQRILETIVELRRDFLDAPTRDDALRIIRERPLELIDVASETGINISIISRHFSTKAVFTPHGIFMLGDLVSPKSRTGEDITVSALHDKILKVIRQGDSEGRFFSDQKVAETLKEEYEINASREHVQKIRKKYAILNSRQRRAKGD
ncbi:MAG: hypothetical protein MIO92_02600, partial [Methanosarcinaceae archaeon]|nr:hypothetical protein [Methanosarcinaceae archaeon]